MSETKSTTLQAWATLADGSRVALSESEVEAIVRAVDEAQARRAEAMPDEQAALRALHDAHTRLKELGWREAVYCPKDGSGFDVIEIGSTGIHRGHYNGEWPTGHLMVGEGFDFGPSRHAILFRLDPEAEAARKAEMEARQARYLAEVEADNAG